MFPLIFQIPQLPDLKSQKYLSLYGQGVRQKVLSSQKDFLLLLSDIGRVYHLTFSIRYDVSDVRENCALILNILFVSDIALIVL